jgi:acetoin:2,6-dichlorophenolindophenol oxidoreductase subunit beta
MRELSYAGAINEALHQEMRRDSRVFVYGIGVPTHNRIFGTVTGLEETFGPDRCFDTPICEEAMTGFGLGAAIKGLRPVHVHIRADFVMIAMNQIVNMVSSFIYGTGGRARVPLVIRIIIGRGWGQGYQHSKSLHSFFAHIPGLKVALPTSPYDAKGLTTAAIRDDNPVVLLEHRWLYWAKEQVPEESYEIPFGKGRVVRQGKDITIVATSWMNIEAMHAARVLSQRGVEVEVVDPRSIAPLDEEIIIQSVEKTRRCIVADIDWAFSGFSAELSALIAEKCFGKLLSPVSRIGFAHTPCPTVRVLENTFYPNASTIIREVEKQLNLQPMDLSQEDFFSHEKKFFGPF